ncbi:MAG TPA: Rrf2 family transcriptional regulator [Prolixibacteraceae bacterium]|jgi:Rrf2 family protein|nr:Rrf2 family transcriptional regulator [Prolixibacteraceae bacterium]
MLSNTCKYAVRALIYLGKYSEDGTKIGIKKISSDLMIPTPFLGKILQNLVRQKVLVSTKGPHGGFGLGKKTSEISLYDIVRIVDGDDFFRNCLIGMQACSTHENAEKPCPVHSRFGPIRAQLLLFYQETSIAGILGDMTGFEDLIKL